MANKLQHTVRFDNAEESKLAAMMAASAGVSMSEWLATAARERMMGWLNVGFSPLQEGFTKPIKDDLERHLKAAPGPALQR